MKEAKKKRDLIGVHFSQPDKDYRLTRSPKRILEPALLRVKRSQGDRVNNALSWLHKKSLLMSLPAILLFKNKAQPSAFFQ